MEDWLIVLLQILLHFSLFTFYRNQSEAAFCREYSLRFYSHQTPKPEFPFDILDNENEKCLLSHAITFVQRGGIIAFGLISKENKKNEYKPRTSEHFVKHGF